MFGPNFKVVRYAPDAATKGGQKTGLSRFTSTPINDTLRVEGVYPYIGSWVAEGGRGAIPLSSGQTYFHHAAFTHPLALHSFSRYDKTNPTAVATVELLGCNASISSFKPFIATYKVWNFSNEVDVVSHDRVLRLSTGGQPARFLTIGERCLIFDGAGEAQWYAGVNANPKSYVLGIMGPPTAPVVDLNQDQTFDYYSSKDSTHLGSPDVDSLFSLLQPAETFTIQLPTPPGGAVVTETAIAAGKSGTTVSTLAGFNLGPFPLPVQCSVIDTVAGDPRVYVYAIGLVLTSRVVGAKFTFPLTGNPVASGVVIDWGTTYVVLDNPAYATWHKTGSDCPYPYDQFAFSLSGSSVAVTPAIPATVTYPAIAAEWPQSAVSSTGMLHWSGSGPSWAYAYYDAVTGHMSNISPIFPAASTITGSGTNITIDLHEGPLIYPSAVDRLRFKYIVFFRTLLDGGSTLFVVGGLDPTQPEWKGIFSDPALNPPVWTDIFPDSDLLVNGVFQAPIDTNQKPRIVQNSITRFPSPKEGFFWDGRLWIVTTEDPSTVYFSGDLVQCPLGRSEECFPDTNRLKIPSDDGQVTGMNLVGEQGLISTQRWGYTIVGNNERNYRLVRVTTLMPGVHTNVCAEIISQAENQGSAVAFLGTDHRVYLMPLGGNPTWVSMDVQDIIDACFDGTFMSARDTYLYSRLHFMSSGGRRALILTLPGTTSYFPILVYDFDNQMWTLRYLFKSTGTQAWASAFTTMYGQDPSPCEIVGFNDVTSSVEYAEANRWLDPTILRSVSDISYVSTFPSGFDGQKTHRALQFVRIYVNATPTGGNWTLDMNVDFERIVTGAIFKASADPTVPWIKDAGVSSLYELIVPIGEMTADGRSIYGYNFEAWVHFPQTATRLRLYAIDIGFTVSSDGLDP